MKKLVFVCSGNICRSPMAAAFARERLKDRGVPAVVVSAGTLNIRGRPAAAHGIAAMNEVGVDMQSHYSQGIQRAMLEMADWIVVMSPKHEDFIASHAPHVMKKVVRMWEWSERELTQIDDPVGQDLVAFRACRDLLSECIDAWLDDAFPQENK